MHYRSSHNSYSRYFHTTTSRHSNYVIIRTKHKSRTNNFKKEPTRQTIKQIFLQFKTFQRKIFKHSNVYLRAYVIHHKIHIT